VWNAEKVGEGGGGRGRGEEGRKREGRRGGRDQTTTASQRPLPADQIEGVYFVVT